MTLPRRWSVRVAQPPEQCSHTDGEETRSKGRERKRYADEVSAPTGQIWMVLPEKYDWKGSPSPVPTCWNAPRSSISIIGSPAIWLEKRVQRAHSTHLSRSSSTCSEIGTGLANVRFAPSNRESAEPADMAWFCSGHSPPLSQTGQSSGWLMSSSSITPRCAFSATGEESCVLTTMPSVHVMVQDAIGLRWPSTSTMHWRHAPTGSSSGWSQKRGISMPELLGGADDQSALGHGDFGAVDGEGDHVLGFGGSASPPGRSCVCGDCHAFTSG